MLFIILQMCHVGGNFNIIFGGPPPILLQIEILRISLIETESESGTESKGDITIFVVVIGNVCYRDWGSKWDSTAKGSDHCLFIYLLYMAKF